MHDIRLIRDDPEAFDACLKRRGLESCSEQILNLDGNVRAAQTRRDGLLAVRIGSLNFEHHKQFVDDVITVPDAALPRAMRLLLDRHKLVVEPSGAITVAAILEGLVKPLPRTVCLLSGGNIEWDGLQELLGDGAT